MLANLMISEVFRLLDGEDAKIPLNPASLAKIADMTEQSLISVGTAKKTIDAPLGHARRPGGIRHPHGTDANQR